MKITSFKIIRDTFYRFQGEEVFLNGDPSGRLMVVSIDANNVIAIEWMENFLTLFLSNGEEMSFTIDKDSGIDELLQLWGI